MEVRTHAEEFGLLLNAVLPAVVRDAATSEGGRLYRAVMSRVEMPLLRQEDEDRQHERPPAAVAPSMGPIPVT